MVADVIEKAWKAGKPKPVYVFHGEEEFPRSELLHLAPALLVPDESTRSFNFDLLYGAETSISQVISVAMGYPMMADRRLVIVREAEKLLRTKPAGSSTASKGKKKQMSDDPLLRYLETPNPDSVLIFDMSKMGPRNQSPFRELAEKAEVIEFAPMKDAEVTDWIKSRAKKFKMPITDAGARLMVTHLGISLRTHANELDKLITFASGKTEITEKDVEQVVGASREHNVFELTKAIGTNNKSLAATIAIKMLQADKDQRHVMFVMLARFIEQLTIAREMMARNEGEKAIADALELRGGAAYFVKETMGFARRYTRERLDQAMKALVEAEASTRKTSIGDQLLVETVVLRLLPTG